MSIVIAPQPTMVVTLSNVASGGTAGKLDKGDKITIVYSAQMSVASFCSTWSGDTTNQTLSASGVLVNVSNGATRRHDRDRRYVRLQLRLVGSRIERVRERSSGVRRLDREHVDRVDVEVRARWSSHSARSRAALSLPP